MKDMSITAFVGTIIPATNIHRKRYIISLCVYVCNGLIGNDNDCNCLYNKLKE